MLTGGLKKSRQWPRKPVGKTGDRKQLQRLGPFKDQMRRYSFQRNFNKTKQTSSQDTSCQTVKASWLHAHKYDITHSRQGTPVQRHNTKEPFPGSCGWKPVLVHTALQQNAARIQQIRKCLRNSLEEARRAQGTNPYPQAQGGKLGVSLGYTT